MTATTSKPSATSKSSATVTENGAPTENVKPTRSTPSKQSTRLTDEQILELLELTKGAKSVELKLTVPDSARYSTLVSLGIDPLDAEIRQVVFFDTPDLTLNAAGVVPRARRVQQKGGDTVIKLRPVVPADLPASLRNLPNMGIEVDAMPGGFVCSASFKGVADDADVTAVIAGKLPIRKLFSKQQRAFYEEHAPDGIALDDLSILGPITVFKLKWMPKDYNRKMVAELWSYPDGTRVLELSTKCLPSEAFQTGVELRAYMTKHGVDLSGDQQSKTKTALEYYAGIIKGQAA